MNPGVEFVVIYSDHHLLELRLTASNGVFYGEVEMCVTVNAVPQFADQLKGFPASSSDRRDCVLGGALPESEGAEARFRLSCRDAAGHGVLMISLRARPGRFAEGPDVAAFHIPVEAGAVDRFVGELANVAAGIRNSARLEVAA
jgi:hypothetical protein